ncbi:MAG: hypothetical protein R8G66_04320 [Cytophagales bacterium]|nr:hypothetical protein [Cytophagales bacterium]
MNKSWNIPSLEQRIFVIILIATILYLITNLIFEVFSAGVDSFLFKVYVLVLIICIILLFPVFNQNIKTYQINFFALFLISIFTYYAPNSAGPTGGTGYTLQNLIVILILMTNGRMLTFMTLCLAGLVLVLFTDVITYSGKLNYLQLVIDYGVNLLFLGVFMVIFKRMFDQEREKLEHNNNKIASINTQLAEKARDLKKTNEDIQQIRDNLQQKVLERTKELEEENQKLIEYSFINAHLIRAPLTNIAGATQLKEDDPKFREIQRGIQEMDMVLKKIAQVLK